MTIEELWFAEIQKKLASGGWSPLIFSWILGVRFSKLADAVNALEQIILKSLTAIHTKCISENT